MREKDRFQQLSRKIVLVLQYLRHLVCDSLGRNNFGLKGMLRWKSVRT